MAPDAQTDSNGRSFISTKNYHHVPKPNASEGFRCNPPETEDGLKDRNVKCPGGLPGYNNTGSLKHADKTYRWDVLFDIY